MSGNGKHNGAPRRLWRIGFAGGWRSWLRRAILFAAVLAVLGGGVSWVTSNDAAFGCVQRAVAGATSCVLNVCRQGTSVQDGNTVASNRFAISVVAACTGLFMTAVFVAAVLVYPSRWWAKLVGVGIGVFGLFALNVARLVCLFFVGTLLPRYVDQAHLLVLQSVLILGTLLLWLVWVEKVAHASIKS